MVKMNGLYKNVEAKVNKSIKAYIKNLDSTLLGLMIHRDELIFIGENMLDRSGRESTQWYLEFELLGGEGHATNLYNIGWIKKDMTLNIAFTLNRDKEYIDADNDYYVPLECNIFLDKETVDTSSVDLGVTFDTEEVYDYIKDCSLSDFE